MNKSVKIAIAVIVAVVVILAGYKYLTTPDNRSATDRIGDAVHDLPNGLDKASRDLEDRTPGQRLGDDIKDMGNSIKDQTAPQH